MTPPLLTVGITAYNDERYLGQCIDSVLGQTHPAIEVLVVDDCSTDGTSDIIRSYGEAVRHIRHETNSGSLVQGRRDVIEQARGQFVHHLDADDFLDPTYAERLLDEFGDHAEPRYDWVACNIRVVGPDGQQLKEWRYDRFPTDPDDALRHGWETASLCFPMKAIYRLAWVREKGLSWYRLESTAMGEDGFTSIQYVRQRPRMFVVPETLLNYRIHTQNMSNSVRERVKMMVELREYYVSEFDESVYLPAEELAAYPRGSNEYTAHKHYLIAKGYAERSCRVAPPPVYYQVAGEPLPEPADLTQYAAVMNAVIRRHSALSLEAANTHAEELRDILASLPTDPHRDTREF